MRSGLILKDKVALIVGASQGIGAAIAEEFVACGARVMLGSRNLDRTRALADRLPASGGATRVVRADLADPDSLAEAAAFTLRTFGRLDAAVNCGGVNLPATDFTEFALDDYDALMGVNLRGVFVAMQHQVRAMLRGGGGSIVNIGSGASILGVPRKPIYAASKHGLVGLTKSVALEFATRNIRVNILCPGAIDTDMFNSGTAAAPDALAKRVQAIPMGRVGQAREVASAAAWLCSDGASYTTGIVMPVDGGVTAP